MKMYPSGLEAAPELIRLTLVAALCHVRKRLTAEDRRGLSALFWTT